MIAGNRSNDSTTRRVSVWDRLEVNGSLTASGDTHLSGLLAVGGMLDVGDLTGLPPNAPVAGVRANNVVTSTVQVGANGQLEAFINPDGSIYSKSNILCEGVMRAGQKLFEIDHPSRPGRRLAHGSLEGPEFGVYYRGEAHLDGGSASVELPGYFEALTSPDGRTVQLTIIAEDDQPVPALAASRVRDGQFRVRTADGSSSTAAFFWEVTAVRADVPALDAEPEPAPVAAPAPAPPAEGR
jgi:hypothetical protein